MKSYNEFLPNLLQYPSSVDSKDLDNLDKGLEGLYKVLQIGPLGLERYLHLKKLELRNQKVRVLLSSEDFGFEVDGFTAYDEENHDNFIITIATNSVKEGERKYNWSEEEMIYIVGIHESRHIVEPASTLGKFYLDFADYTYFGDHINHLELEFQARLEYSLLYPSKADKKNNWLENYLGYYEMYRRIESPTTELEQEIKSLYINNKSQDKGTLKRKLSKLRKSLGSSDFKLGTANVKELLRKYFGKFEERLQVYREYNALYNGRVKLPFESDTAIIKDEIEKYVGDTKLSFLN